jgi:hypothetical protein
MISGKVLWKRRAASLTDNPCFKRLGLSTGCICREQIERVRTPRIAIGVCVIRRLAKRTSSGELAACPTGEVSPRFSFSIASRSKVSSGWLGIFRAPCAPSGADFCRLSVTIAPCHTSRAWRGGSAVARGLLLRDEDLEVGENRLEAA